ncbi:MAG: hypothetical protein U1F22_02055 [Lysobacterales bacterium]
MEPTIGTFDLTRDPVEFERARAAAESRMFWNSVRDWVGLVVAFGMLIGGALWFAVHQGLIQIPDRIDSEALPQRVLIVGGFALVFLSQLVGAIALIGRNPVASLKCLLVPGYGLMALRRETYYRPVMGSWLAGLLAVSAGTIWFGLAK